MLDTNILISAFIFRSEKMNNLIYELSKKHEIFICSYTIEELEDLVENKFYVSIKALKSFLKNFPYTLAKSPINPKEDVFFIRDKEDYIILYTAIKENVDIFITGDKDFDDVNIKKPEILKPTEFINKYILKNI